MTVVLTSSSLPLATEEARHAQALFVDHQPWLLGRLHQRLRDRAHAEDVASETFVKVISARGLADIREPRAFLTTVAKRVLHEFWRRRDLEQAYVDACLHLPDGLAPSPEDRALLLESLAQVIAALDGMSARARQAFLLSQLDGLTYAEIALRLDVSASMVRKYMVQGWRACALATGIAR
ncbi:MAG: sigma-70 family RNA polymerase sigma factor [Pseudomonadota bacterium]